jgi:sugar lactone lactonase YvrE
MWFADSGDGTVDAFDFDVATGSIAGRRTVIRIPEDEGVPDGLCVDAEDHLWVAVWDGGEVRRYTPGGELVARVRVPAHRPTSCCFGGPGLDVLYISTAGVDLTDAQRAEQPLAGRLFRAGVGVRGVAQPRFG